MVVVVVVTMVVTPLHSGTPPVKTGRKGMQAGETSGDMGLTLGRLLQCSQQVRLKPCRRAARMDRVAGGFPGRTSATWWRAMDHPGAGLWPAPRRTGIRFLESDGYVGAQGGADLVR